MYTAYIVDQQIIYNIIIKLINLELDNVCHVTYSLCSTNKNKFTINNQMILTNAFTEVSGRTVCIYVTSYWVCILCSRDITVRNHGQYKFT